MARTLVLNATEEPLAIVSSRRAVVLVIDEKADPVHLTGQRWRAEHVTTPVPSVVRLRYYVRVPHRRCAALSRRGVFLRDGGTCQYCGRAAENIDHVVPRSRGGLHTWENVVACCARCNATKRDRLLAETRMRLRRRPQVPRDLSWVTVAVGAVPPSWLPYVAGLDRPPSRDVAGGSVHRRAGAAMDGPDDGRGVQRDGRGARTLPGRRGPAAPEQDPIVAAAG